MELDPQAKQLLNLMAGMEIPPIRTLEPAQLREMMTLPPPAEVATVARVENLFAEGPYRPIPIRLYTPEGRGQGPTPLVVFFHGGGFLMGNLDSYDPMCRTLCQQTGMLVASVDYALAPEAKFPRGVEECFAATCWLTENARSISADPERIAVAGDSAGGCLAAVVTQMARARQGPAIAHQVLIYPVTDCSFNTDSYRQNAEGYFLTREMMQWFWQHYLTTADESSNPMASPLRADDLSGLPGATIITAGFDPLRDEGIAYCNRLQAAGVATHSRHFPGMFHGFLSFPEAIDSAVEATEYLCQRLKIALLRD